MKKAEAFLEWSLEAICPYCEGCVDLADQDEEGNISQPIFNNSWEKLSGIIVHCPDCSNDFEISKVEY